MKRLQQYGIGYLSQGVKRTVFMRRHAEIIHVAMDISNMLQIHALEDINVFDSETREFVCFQSQAMVTEDAFFVAAFSAHTNPGAPVWFLFEIQRDLMGSELYEHREEQDNLLESKNFYDSDS